MREIVPGIFVITEKGRLNMFMPAVNLYVLAGPDGLVFDAGYGNSAMVALALREIGVIEDHYRDRGLPFHLNRIMPSHAHPDHVSGLRLLRRRLGLSIMLTARTAHIIQSRKNYNRTYNIYREPFFADDRSLAARLLSPVKKGLLYILYNYIYGKAFIDDPDEIIEDERQLTINGEFWRVILTPGHASDHVSLYNAARGILLGGDNVLPGITTWLGPPDADLDTYAQTLERIAAIDGLSMILPAHGGPVTAPIQRIEQLLAGRRRRTDQVLRIVREGGTDGVTMADLMTRLYGGQGMVTRDLARGWVILTLLKLADEGAIVMGSGGDRRRIVAAD